MKRTALCAAIGLTLSGCSLLAPLSFKASPDSGADSDKSFMALFPSGSHNFPSDPRLAPAITADVNLRAAAIRSSCVSPPPPVQPGGPQPVAAAVVPLLAAAAQYGFNYLVDRRRDQIQEIVDAAQASYSVNSIVEKPLSLTDSPCLLFVRYGIDKDGGSIPGLVALLRLTKIKEDESSSVKLPSAFSIEPAYVRAFNAVALTKEGAERAPTINASFAISIKAAGLQGSNVPRLLPAGEGVVTVAKLPIGKAGGARCNSAGDECRRSDIVTFPINKGALSLSLAVTEQGTTGFNDKTLQAELVAIKEAFGPALAEAVKAKFGD